VAMIAPNRGLTGKQRAALDLLAGCPDGCTEAAMKANGFGIGLLATLIRAGLAVAPLHTRQRLTRRLLLPVRPRIRADDDAGCGASRRSDAGRGADRDHGDGASDGRRMMGQVAGRAPGSRQGGAGRAVLSSPAASRAHQWGCQGLE
jgi:hypothetical protein